MRSSEQYSAKQLQDALLRAQQAGDENAVKELSAALKSRDRFAVTELERDTGIIENLTKGVGAGIVGTLESAALGAATLLEEEAETNARRKIQDVASGFMPSGGDPQSGFYKFGAGLGSLATFAVPGGVAAKGAQALGAGAKAQRLAGLGTAGATGMGAGAGEASERARAAGATEAERSRAAGFGTLIGATEVAPLGRFMKQLEVPILSDLVDKLGPKQIENIQDRVRNAVVTGGLEAGQEATAAILQNVNEKYGYNPERALLDAGVSEEALIGGQVGGAVQLFTDLFYRGRKIGDIPPPPPLEGQGDLFQAELDKAKAEKAKVQGAPKPDDLDARKKEQAAKERRKDPQGDLFPVEAEQAKQEAKQKAKQMDLFDEPKKEDAPKELNKAEKQRKKEVDREVDAEVEKRPELKLTEEEIQAQKEELFKDRTPVDSIKQMDLFGTPAKALDEAVDPKVQKAKPKELPQPVLVGTPEGEVGTEQDVKQAAKEKEAVVGDKPKEEIVKASEARQAEQAEQKARTEEKDPQGDMFTAEKQAARRTAKQVDDVITSATLDQLGVPLRSKLRKELINKPVADANVQQTLKTVNVKDPAVRARLNELIETPVEQQAVLSKQILTDLGIPKDAPVRAEVQGERLADVKDTLLTYARKQGQKGLTTEARNKIISFAQGTPASQGVLDIRGRRNAKTRINPEAIGASVQGSPTNLDNRPTTTTTDTGATAPRAGAVGEGSATTTGVGGGTARRNVALATPKRKVKNLVAPRKKPTSERPKRKQRVVKTNRKTAIQLALEEAQAKQPPKDRTTLTKTFDRPFAKGTTMKPFFEDDRTVLSKIRTTPNISKLDRARKTNKLGQYSAKLYLDKYDNDTSALLAAIDESIRGTPQKRKGDEPLSDAEKELFQGGVNKDRATDFVEYVKANFTPEAKAWVEKQEAAVKSGYVTEADERRRSDTQDASIEKERTDKEAERVAANKARTSQARTDDKLKAEISATQQALRVEREGTQDDAADAAAAEAFATRSQATFDGLVEELSQTEPAVADALVDLNRELGLDVRKTVEDIALQEQVSSEVFDALQGNDLKGALEQLAKTTESKELKKLAEKIIPVVGTTKVFVVDPSVDITDPVASAALKYANYRSDEFADGVAPLGTFISTDTAKREELIDVLGEEGAASLANSIILNPYVYGSTTGDAISAQVLLHEVYHAGTVATLENPSHPMTKRITAIYEAVKDDISNTYAKENIFEFVAEVRSDPDLRAELAFLSQRGGKLLDKGPQENMLVRYYEAVKDWIANLINYRRKGVDAKTGVDHAIDQILKPEVGGYVPSVNYDKVAITEKVGNLQKILSSKPAKEVKVSTQEGWRKLWRSPKKVLTGAAYIAPSEMLADMAATTDVVLGKLANNLHVQFQSMRGKTDQQMKIIGGTVERLTQWEKSATEAQIKAFNNVVHNSTLARVDPSKPASEYTGKQLEEWNALQNDFDALGAKGQKMYTGLRDAYKAQYLELKEVIKGRVNALAKDNPELAKELENKVLSKIFDAANIDPYFPLTRFGDYKLGYSLKATREGDEDAYVFKMFPTHAERDAWIEENVENNPDVIDGSIELQFGDRPMSFKNVPPTSFVMQTANMLKQAKGVDEKTIRQFMQSFIEVLPEAAVAKGFATRQGTIGFQEDAVLAFRLKAPQLARQTERMRASVQIDALRAEISELQPPNEDRRGVGQRLSEAKGKRAAIAEELTVPYEVIQNELIARAEFAMNPPKGNLEEIAQRANQLGFVYTIGWNASSAVVNMSQIPLFVIPYLSARHGLGKTTGAMNNALSLLSSSGTFRDPLMASVNKFTLGKYGKNAKKYGKVQDLTGETMEMHTMPSIDNYFILDQSGEYTLRDDFNWPEGAEGKKLKEQIELIQPLVQEMGRRGQLNSSFISDTMGVDYNTSVTSSSFRKLADLVTKTSAFMFHHVEQYNRQATHIASFILEYNKLSNDAETKDLTTAEKQTRAIEYALRETQRINGGTNLETTGRIGQQGVGRVAWMYKSYGVRMYATMLTSLKRFVMQFEDVNVRKQTFKEMLGITGTSLFFAGARGFPLYGAVAVLANLYLDDDEEDFDTIVRKKIGEGWYKGAITNMTGADVSSRVALSGLLLQVNRYNHDASAEETLGFYIGGPSWSSVKKIGRGLDDLREGEIDRGVEGLMPGAISNVLKGQRYAEEGAQTRRKDPIMEEVSDFQVAMQMFGFSPAEYNARQDRNMITKKQDRTITNKVKKLKKAAWVAKKSGDINQSQKAYQDIDEWNNSELVQKNPELRITYKDLEKSFKSHDRTTETVDDGITISKPLTRLFNDQRSGWDLQDY